MNNDMEIVINWKKRTLRRAELTIYATCDADFKKRRKKLPFLARLEPAVSRSESENANH